MAINPAEFRIAFPEFSDVVIYTNTVIQRWLTYSTKLVNEQLWHELYQDGVFLLTAHNLILFNSTQITGSVSGQSQGVVSSKSVKGVSVSYDNNLNIIAEAGMYNQSKYGQQFYQLLQLFPSFTYLGY